MANYSISVLGENQMTFSDGAQLDGVTQGDGSHLDGVSITFTSSFWQPVAIVDDDTDFRDNDTSQRLDGAQTINGVAYSGNTIVEAEYGITVTDGTNTWTLVGFNVRDSPTSYATIEGLALLDSPQGPPPVGVPLLVTGSFEGPNFQATQYAQPVCFVTGSLVDTVAGPVPVERIRPGMEVLTRDHGVSEVLWTGARRVFGKAEFAPVRLRTAAGSVLVSQNHRVLLSDWRAELYFGLPEVLIAAKHLVGICGAEILGCGPVGYHHLLLKDHAVVRTGAIWSESFCLGPQALDALLPQARSDVLHRFPELAGRRSDYPVLRGYESAILDPCA